MPFLRAPLPRRRQHAPDDEVEEAVIEPLGFAGDAFALKTEALGNGAASVIAGGAADLHAVQAQIEEEVVEQRRRAARDYALALTIRVQPVADAGAAVFPIDWVAANGADERAIQPDARLRAQPGIFLRGGAFDVERKVRRRFRIVYPRQSLPEALPVPLHCHV
jgi:hypothetical protein